MKISHLLVMKSRYLICYGFIKCNKNLFEICRDYILAEDAILLKFHVVNRIRSKVCDLVDMSIIRQLFMRVQDYY